MRHSRESRRRTAGQEQSARLYELPIRTGFDGSHSRREPLITDVEGLRPRRIQRGACCNLALMRQLGYAALSVSQAHVFPTKRAWKVPIARHNAVTPMSRSQELAANCSLACFAAAHAGMRFCPIWSKHVIAASICGRPKLAELRCPGSSGIAHARCSEGRSRRRLTTACSRRPSQSSNLHTQICRLSGARLMLAVRRHYANRID